MENLQELINKKARVRAKNDVQELIKNIKKNNSILSILDKIYLIDEDKKKSIRSAFWSPDNNLPRYIIDELTKVYIPEESKAFLKKVDQLSEEINDLKSMY